MAGINALRIILDNGRRRWDQEVHRSHPRATSITKVFWALSRKLDPATKKKIYKAVGIAIFANLIMYRTCLCFYNIEIGYYNEWLGFGINTYATRFIQL